MEIDRPSPAFRRVLRLFSLGLYFMMFIATVAAISWGWEKSTKLKHAQVKIEQLESELKDARARLRSLESEGATAGFDMPEFEIIRRETVQHPLPPLRTARPVYIAPAGTDSLKDRTISVQQAQIEELERQLAEALTAAREMARRAQEATEIVSIYGAAAVGPESADPISSGWQRAVDAPEDRAAAGVLVEALRNLSDEELVAFLKGRSGSGGSPDQVALYVLRTRAPSGGDELAASLLRRALLRAGDQPVELSNHIAALEPYRTDVARDGLFAVVVSRSADPATRATALWPLLLAGDFRGAAVVGEVYASLEAGSSHRTTILGLAISTKDVGMLDAVLGALADPASTTEELTSASEACRVIREAAAPRVAVLAEALAKRGASQERVRLVSALATELKGKGG
jgi:hypothetical protein